MTKIRRDNRVTMPASFQYSNALSSIDHLAAQQVPFRLPQPGADFTSPSLSPDPLPSTYQSMSQTPTMMELDAPSSTDGYSGTPGSTLDFGAHDHNTKEAAHYGLQSPESGHSSILPRPPPQVNAHSRAYSDSQVPIQPSMVFEDWQSNLMQGHPATAATAQRPTNPSSTGAQFWNQPLEANGPGTMLPRELHYMYDLEESWSCFEEPSRLRANTQAQSQAPIEAVVSELFSGDLQGSKPQSLSRLGMSSWSEAEASKPGIRSGPLPIETRQNASDVRKEGSCLRCFVMRESCDVGTPCRNCHQKAARSWKFGKQCIRPRLPHRYQYLLPEPLINRLKKAYVADFIGQRGWRAQTSLFALPLDIGLGIKLDLPVREYCPYMVGTEYSAAYLNEMTEDGPRAVEVYQYDLPVVISCHDEHAARQHIRNKLKESFAVTMQTRNNPDSKWAEHWFNDPSDVFQCEVMSLICEYYRPDLHHQHNLIETALALSFFSYIFTHSFEVPEEHIPYVLRNMVRPPDVQQHNLKWVVPSTVNRYIKMVYRPPLVDVAQRTLKGLENLLLDTDNRSMWRRDVIFCVTFIVIAYLGKTQNAVIQAADQPEPHESSAIPAFSLTEAQEEVRAMEIECVNVLIGYSRQFMKPSPRRKNYRSGSPSKSKKARPEDPEAEKHAEGFELMRKVAELKEQHAAKMPDDLELHKSTVSEFMARNSQRVCWKFVNECLQI